MILFLICNLAEPFKSLLEGRFVFGWDLFSNNLFNGFNKLFVNHRWIPCDCNLHILFRSGTNEGFESILNCISLGRHALKLSNQLLSALRIWVTNLRKNLRRFLSE